MKHLELLVIEERNLNGMRICLKPNTPEVLTPTLIYSIRNLQDMLIRRYLSTPWEGYFYVIWYFHKNCGVKSRGLDFNFIFDSVSSHHDKEFENYINNLFDLLFLNYIGLGIPLINCSIVDRTLSGVSQEFFILNQINFLKNTRLLASNHSILEIHLQDIAKNVVFPLHIYKKNLFYTFYSYDFHSMQRLLSRATINFTQTHNIKAVQSIFDAIKNETISQIYEIASKKINVLYRLAKIQQTNNSIT